MEIHRKSPGVFLPLSDDDFPLVVITHNDMRLMRSFFRHYRSMGVTRFFCMDDASTDGTQDFILDQPDADLFTSNVRYKDADRGKIWREKLFDILGHDRWYLNVDSDEYFLYESISRETIGEYTRRLDTAGVSRVPAPMLDLYPMGDVSRAVFSGANGAMPWEVATHFDGDGYTANAFKTGMSIYGGVRARVFRSRGELMKYPLIRWDRYCSLGRTIHRPRPHLYNFAPTLGVLLHFKIFSDVGKRPRRRSPRANITRGPNSTRPLSISWRRWTIFHTKVQFRISALTIWCSVALCCRSRLPGETEEMDSRNPQSAKCERWNA